MAIFLCGCDKPPDVVWVAPGSTPGVPPSSARLVAWEIAPAAGWGRSRSLGVPNAASCCGAGVLCQVGSSAIVGLHDLRPSSLPAGWNPGIACSTHGSRFSFFARGAARSE